MRERGDEQRFGEWVCAHRATVRAFVFAMVRRADVAEDLTQDVFCRAWKARASYEEHGKGLAYLLRIADRLACNWNRRQKPVVNLDEEGWRSREPTGPALTPHQAAASSEEKALLAEAMERLSVDQQRVLLLRYYGQLSFAEIAQITGNPLNTTVSHCRRGIEALRKLLGPCQ
jgi:RNA polymerase sigma-70 factor, ECF subfamily